MPGPTVSVIMPVFNGERFLDKAISSVAQQDFGDWELIVVNDGSEDDSLKIAESWSGRDRRIRVISGQNQGVAEARNKGITQARGKYIAFLDADDMWKAHKLRVQLDFLQTNSLHLTYASYDIIDERETLIKSFEAPAQITFEDMLKSNWIGNLTGLYDVEKCGKRFFQAVGHEDYVMYLELMRDLKVTRGLTESLACYRQSSAGLSGNKMRTIRWQWRIYRQNLNLNVLQASYYMLFYAYHGLTKYRKIE